MLRGLLCIWLFCFSMDGFAQSKIIGKVSDVSTGEALAGVVVYLYNGNVILAYAVSEADGCYTITCKERVTRLVFYQMGYKSVSVSLNGETFPSLYKADVQMEEDVISLKSITVKPVAVAVKGDTITYDASAFVRKEDQSLGEVLRRLPNVAVTTNGGITVKGTRINKFYIEDMDLLGGRYGIAVNNIRAEDIASISVYNNHQPVKALKEVEITNQAALNIKLKEKAKNRWLLSFGAAAGFPDFLYSAKLNAMNFARSSQTVVTAKTDGSGENIVRETAVQNLKPGHYRMEQLEGMEDLFPIPRIILSVPQEYYYMNQSNAFTINRLNKLKNDVTVKENIIFTTNRLSNDVSTVQTVEPSAGEAITILDTSHFKRDDIRVSGEITFTSNREKMYLEDVLSFKVLMDKARVQTIGPADTYRQQYDLPKYAVENKFSYMKNKRGTVYKFCNTLAFSHLDENLTVVSEQLNPLFNTYTVVQNISADNFTADTYLSFVKKAAKISFSFTPGVNLWYKKYNSFLNPPMEIPGEEDRAMESGNNLSLFSLQPYLNASAVYQYKKMKWEAFLLGGFRYDLFNRKASVYGIYRPVVRLEYDISSKLKVGADASVSNQIGDIEKMASGYIYSSYRNFQAYESASKQVNQHYRGTVRYSNYASFWFADLSASYSIDASNLMPSEVYLQNYTFTVYTTGERQFRRMFDIGLNVKKFLGINKYRIGMGIRYTGNHSEQYLQGSLYKYKTDGYSVNFELGCFPSELFSVEYRADFNGNVFRARGNETIYHLTNKISMIVFPCKKLELKGTFYHFFQSRPEYDNVSLPFLDFKVEYKVQPKWSVYCKMDNVMNTKNYSSTRFSGVSIVSKNTRLRGAGYLFGVSLDF